MEISLYPFLLALLQTASCQLSDENVTEPTNDLY